MQRYYSTKRPLGPGAFPRMGGTEIITNFQGKLWCSEIEDYAWGYIEYPRAITQKAESGYELTKAGSDGRVYENEEGTSAHVCGYLTNEQLRNVVSQLGRLLEYYVSVPLISALIEAGVRDIGMVETQDISDIFKEFHNKYYDAPHYVLKDNFDTAEDYINTPAYGYYLAPVKNAEPPKTSHLCYEVCPHCNEENTFIQNPQNEGYVARCHNCGKEIFLCDECLHSDDNKAQKCGWHDNGCWRGKTKNMEE